MKSAGWESRIQGTGLRAIQEVAPRIKMQIGNQVPLRFHFRGESARCQPGMRKREGERLIPQQESTKVKEEGEKNPRASRVAMSSHRVHSLAPGET